MDGERHPRPGASGRAGAVRSAQDAGQEAVGLSPATVERLDKLLDETADMSVALGRLLDADRLDDCPIAMQELRKAMDRRLAEAIDLVSCGTGEARS